MRSATRATTLAALVVGLAIAGCGSGPGPTPLATGSPAPVSTIAPTASASTSPGATTGGSLQAVESDPALFAVIGGDSGDGLTFTYDPDTTARVAADPGLAGDAVGLAIGLYTVTGQQPVADFAIVSVVHLRDPALDAGRFRSYRDSYDQAACAQAGGVGGHAEATIRANKVFIGSCVGGAFTYHVHLAPRGIVVSITAVGPGRLGERIAGDVGKMVP